jgi:hypothetical protein
MQHGATKLRGRSRSGLASNSAMLYIINMMDSSAPALEKGKSGLREYLRPSITGFQPLRSIDERPVIFRIACALHPGWPGPVAWLASIADHRRGSRGVARSTAKTWAYGRKHWAYGNRKPPIELFRKLKGLLQDAMPAHENQRVVIELTTLVDQYIWQHERKAVRPLTGFNEIRPRDGPGSTPRDGRNRLGRPKNGNGSEGGRGPADPDQSDVNATRPDLSADARGYVERDDFSLNRHPALRPTRSIA